MLKINLQFFLLVFILAAISACAPAVKKTTAVDKKNMSKIVVQPIEAKEVKEIAAAKPAEDISAQQDVLILLSSSANAYQKMATYLNDALGEHAVQIILSGLPAQDKAVIEDIKASASNQIVAIGLKAAQAVKHFNDKQIFYTQVMTHETLASKKIQGISSLPSPEKLFSDWKKLSPTLSKVAIVSGEHLDAYLKRAKSAAKAQGIELQVELVKSDKGFIYKSKKLKSDVEGQWILPDNRILSGKALKEVMAYASRRGRQVVVFSPKLLSFGGFFYVTPDLQMIAAGVLQCLKESAGKENISGPRVLPIMGHTMGINSNIARQLNLAIPTEYRKYLNEN